MTLLSSSSGRCLATLVDTKKWSGTLNSLLLVAAAVVVVAALVAAALLLLAISLMILSSFILIDSARFLMDNGTR